jgi:uncharacterized membrane protein YphA (DoxX/SURF4 family)
MTSEEYIGKRAPRWYIVLLRLYMACYFLYVGVCRFLSYRQDADALKTKLTELLKVEQFAWFKTYLGCVVDPIKGTAWLTWLLIAAPVLLGLSLFLGFLTRLSAGLGVLYVLNAYLIKFHGGDMYQLMFLQLELVVLVVLFFAASGRTLGIDSALWRKRIRRKFASEPPREPRPVPRPQPRPAPTQVPLSPAPKPRVEESVGHFSTQTPVVKTPLQKPGETKPTPGPGSQ